MPSINLLNWDLPDVGQYQRALRQTEFADLALALGDLLCWDVI